MIIPSWHRKTHFHILVMKNIGISSKWLKLVSCNRLKSPIDFSGKKITCLGARDKLNFRQDKHTFSPNVRRTRKKFSASLLEITFRTSYLATGQVNIWLYLLGGQVKNFTFFLPLDFGIGNEAEHFLYQATRKSRKSRNVTQSKHVLRALFGIMNPRLSTSLFKVFQSVF